MVHQCCQTSLSQVLSLDPALLILCQVNRDLTTFPNGLCLARDSNPQPFSFERRPLMTISPGCNNNYVMTE